MRPPAPLSGRFPVFRRFLSRDRQSLAMDLLRGVCRPNPPDVSAPGLQRTSTRMRVPGIFLALLLTTATAIAAQSAGSFDISGFGRFTRLDNNLRIQEEAGGGGSLAFFPLSNVAIEGEGAYPRTHSNITRNPITNVTLRGRLSYNMPIGGYSSAIRL